MIADWTVDIGDGSPWIEAPWSGWVDLRHDHAQAARLSELQAYPELLPLLIEANTCAILTAKVDVFPVDAEDADPEIAELGAERVAAGVGSYLDLLTERPLTFIAAECIARDAARALRLRQISGSVVEIVLRAARLYDNETFGWTLYAMGFGPDAEAARRTWAEASHAALHALLTAANAGE